ncbi:MAG: S41 family peptidase [Filimonas sp.]|nr:S41 family peptidase [Filimonas sp.]
MGSKKLQVWLPVLFAMVMTVGMFIGYKVKENTSGGVFFRNTQRTSMQEVLDLIKSKYVDDISSDSMKNVVINNVLANLDPHSVYIPAKEVAGVNEQLMGNFQGIGVEFQMFNDTVNVLNVIENGPSFKAGLQVGDKIINVNDSVTLAGKKLKPDDIRKYLRGPGGTSVKVAVLRGSQMQNFTITRGTIPVPSVDVAYMLTPTTGFIRINKFAETTYEEFMFNLEKLQKLGMKQLVLDLRGNGGGLLNEAVDIADEFLDDNKLIVYTEGSKAPRVDFKSKRDGLFETGKLVVLVDETSASASEVLSGALQDWDRATLVGRRTFGKGLVQQQFLLSDGSALRLTVARYYTPLGRNIQKPYNKGKDKYEEELIERFHDGEVVKGDTSKPSGPAFKTKAGHIVYGGGGITPDIFIPYDTTSQPKEISELYFKGTLSNFVYTYYVQNKAQFAQYKSADDFAKRFATTETEWNALTAFAKRDSIDLSKVSAKEKTRLMQYVEAFLARQIWRTEGYFEVINKDDKMVLKALELMK